MQSKSPSIKRVFFRQDDGFSLPIVWIVIVILIILHWVIGWVVWPIALGLGMVISLGVWIYDRMSSGKAEHPPERDK